MYAPSVYNARYFCSRIGRKPRHIIPALVQSLVAELGPFTSSLDLGAGAGFYSMALSGLGVEAWAVELAEEAPVFSLDYVCVLCHDLRLPLDLGGRTFDLVLCIEVAEHLPESAADTLCDTIALHANHLVVFTAAPPGQGGTGHINCQPPCYWRDKLEARGLFHLPEHTERMKLGWARVCGKRFTYLVRNVVVYGGGN